MSEDSLSKRCIMCGKDRGASRGLKTKSPNGQELWICGFPCFLRYGGEHKTWNVEKWNALMAGITAKDYEAQKVRPDQLIQPLTGKAKELLDSALRPNEIIQMCIQSGSGSLVATDSRVMIIETSWQGLFAGPRCDSLPYQSITAIDLSVSWTGGKIRFITHNRADSIWTIQNADELRFHERDYAIFKAAKEKIDELMATARKKATQTAPGPSIPEQIKQLAELKDIGALTQEEFDAKKTELLKRL